MRTICEGDPPALLLQQIVDLGRAERRLLDLLMQGLDAGSAWVEEGVRAGADVLHVLHHLLSAPSPGGQQPYAAYAASSAFVTCKSSFMGLVDCRSRPQKLSSVSEEAVDVTAEAALAAAMRAPADAKAAIAQAASRDLVVEEEGGRVLICLLRFDTAQHAALACIAVLACSPQSAVALALEEGALESLAACLASCNPSVQMAGPAGCGSSGKTPGSAELSARSRRSRRGHSSGSGGRTRSHSAAQAPQQQLVPCSKAWGKSHPQHM